MLSLWTIGAMASKKARASLPVADPIDSAKGAAVSGPVATMVGPEAGRVSTRDTPRWVIMRYYGWRVPFLSMFPNAVSMEPAASRDVRVIPWFNIIILTLTIAVAWAIWARLRRWQRRRADPMSAAWQPARPRRGWFGR